jgi:type III pantothenate kinase
MIVAVDIGNSNVVLGFNDDGQWVDNWRIPTIKDQDAIYYYDVELRTRLLDSKFTAGDIDGIILSTVVPSLRELFKGLLTSIFQSEVVVVGPDLYEELSFQVPRPYEIGTDLVANAYSAHQTFRIDCIVVDFGTALTFTTVSHEGYVQGVAIAPGIKTAMKALSSNTAQLPEIPLQLPSSALGQNTTHAIQAGILWGYVGMTKELLSKIRSEVGEHYVAIATGGLSFVMSPLENVFHTIDRDLTINGLKFMLENVNKLRSQKK